MSNILPINADDSLGAGLLLTASLLLWLVVPPLLAVQRLGRSDL